MSSVAQERGRRKSHVLLGLSFCSVARLTNGCVLPANGENLVEILHTKLPCLAGMKKSMRRKAKFHIAPGLMVEARLSKLTECTTMPSVRREARQLDPVSGNALRDGNGELMTTQTRKMTFHYDGEENLVSLGESRLLPSREQSKSAVSSVSYAPAVRSPTHPPSPGLCAQTSALTPSGTALTWSPSPKWKFWVSRQLSLPQRASR